jgi:hypothetical protein
MVWAERVLSLPLAPLNFIKNATAQQEMAAARSCLQGVPETQFHLGFPFNILLPKEIVLSV